MKVSSIIYKRINRKYIMRKQVYTSLTILIILGMSTQVNAQEKAAIYHPERNAFEQVKQAEITAKKEGKHVFLIIGGNWCRWCRMFDTFSKAELSVDSAFNVNYVVEHINYSKENKNDSLMQLLEFPQRFGFPVFVIIDTNGKRLHTQSTGYLEQGEGYDKEKVIEFLNQWTPEAMNPANYMK